LLTKSPINLNLNSKGGASSILMSTEKRNSQAPTDVMIKDGDEQDIARLSNLMLPGFESQDYV